MKNVNTQRRDGHLFKNYFLLKKKIGLMIVFMNEEILNEKNIALASLDYLDNDNIDDNDGENNHVQSLRSIVSSSVDTSSYLYSIVEREL